jgi:hypothetical protein
MITITYNGIERLVVNNGGLHWTTMRVLKKGAPVVAPPSALQALLFVFAPLTVQTSNQRQFYQYSGDRNAVCELRPCLRTLIFPYTKNNPL